MTIRHIIVHQCDACGADEKASRTTRLRMGPYKSTDLCQACRDKVERFIHNLRPGDGRPEYPSPDCTERVLMVAKGDPLP